MPSDRKFHKVVIKVTVLSEYSFTNELWSLKTVAMNIDSGDDVGQVEVVSHDEIDAKQAVQELRSAGSEPSFFRLTEAGEDAEDE